MIKGTQFPSIAEASRILGHSRKLIRNRLDNPDYLPLDLAASVLGGLASSRLDNALVRGKGVAPVRGGGAGDLLCKVAVETPVNLGKRQRELLEEFRKSLEGDSSHSPKASGWFDGVKRFFGDL